MKKDVASLDPARDADLKAHLRGDPPPESVLCSPELGLLKLASPELERLVVQSHGAGAQFLFPKQPAAAAADEQEFAEGFVKALEDLHKQNRLSGGGGGGSLDLGAHVASDLPVYTNLSSYGSGPLDTTVNYSTDTVPFPPPPPSSHHAGGAAAAPPPPPPKEEPQTVPDVQSFGESPPPSPPVGVDLDSQERMKAERKRLRNRIAASKCRMRKLERISRLEDKVKTLRSHNGDLASTAGLLREQVAHLKRRVLAHVDGGCQLLPPHEVQVH